MTTKQIKSFLLRAKNSSTAAKKVPVPAELMDKFLAEYHRMVTEFQEDLDFICSSGTDEHAISELLKSEEDDAVYEYLSGMKTSEIESLFKAKYKKSSEDIAEALVKKDLSALPSKVKAVLDALNNSNANSVTPKDMKDSETGYRYYQVSPDKICVQTGATGAEFYVTDETLVKQRAKVTYAEVINFFDYFKVKAGKRPTRSRR